MNFTECCHIIDIETHQLQILPIYRINISGNQRGENHIISVKHCFDSQLEIALRLIPLIMISVFAGLAAESFVSPAV